jgi:hypothetical protein
MKRCAHFGYVILQSFNYVSLKYLLIDFLKLYHLLLETNSSSVLLGALAFNEDSFNNAKSATIQLHKLWENHYDGHI